MKQKKKSHASKKKTKKVAQKKSTTTPKKKNLFLTFLIIAIVAVGLFYAITAFQQSSTTNADDTPSDTSTKIAKARVNGEEIYDLDILEMQIALQQQTQTQVNESIVLDGLISQTLMLQEAKKQNISFTDEEVENTMGELLAQQGSTLEAYKSQAKASGMNYEDIAKKFREQMMLQELSTQVLDGYNITISEEAKHTFYDQNAQEAQALGYNVTSYEEIEGQIEQTLVQREQQRIISEFIGRLRSNANIEML